MSRNTNFKVAALAASVALAMGSTAAMAATTAPAAGTLPGKGAIFTGTGAGTVSAGTITSGEQTINITGNAVITWGSGSDINATGTGGFDIGSGAKLHFAGQSGSSLDSVLNIDSSGNPSQIFGTLDDAGALGPTDIFVANSNGVIVGATGMISGNVSLIANKLSSTANAAAEFAADPTTLAYNGTGGDVTVQKGATLNGTVFISGGGNVNVDLSAITAGATRLSAGRAVNAGGFGADNTAAAINVTGQITGGSLFGFDSAGSASNAGVLDLSSVPGSVDGIFTNTGDLTLGANNGAVHNQGKLTTTGSITFNGALTNDGQYSAAVGTNDNGYLTINGGDFVNNGTVTGTNQIYVNDGSVTNTGTLSGITRLKTYSDANYTAGADYSINNSGVISEGINGFVLINANAGTNHSADAGNDTTGSVTNTGTLKLLNAAANFYLYANDNVSLGGTVTVAGSPVSPDNPFHYSELQSFGIDYTARGKVTLTTPLAATEEAYFGGRQVAIMANVTGVGSGSEVWIGGGDKMASDYAVRIGGGVTVSADYQVGVDGYSDTDHPNVILQGTLSADDVYLGANDGASYAVSDLFSGPNGQILLSGGSSPELYINFTGKVKAAPYLNDANFRFNYLPVTVGDNTQTAYVQIDPVNYQAAGSPDAGINLLVNGNVQLADTAASATVFNGNSAVTGVNAIPNTHLVLQSTGNIATAGDFYWPGYVYLGNIAANADGSAAPGTLGYGTITLNGNFNNVLPGDTSGAGGIHFITQYPLVMNGHSVTTNANSWINFGTDQLTAAYAAGAQGAGLFFGGVQGSGNVVNYGDLDPSLFHTQAPVSTK